MLFKTKQIDGKPAIRRDYRSALSFYIPSKIPEEDGETVVLPYEVLQEENLSEILANLKKKENFDHDVEMNFLIQFRRVMTPC